MYLKSILFCITFAFASQTFATKLEVGKKASIIGLKGDEGAKVDGKPWSSEMIKDKMWILFYVDPDEKDLNDALAQALKKREFPKDKVGSLAIINMDATWLPNFAIANSLKEKQEEHPTTIYVKDLKKKLVKEWGLGDDTSCVVLFDESATVLFKKNGKLSAEDIKSFMALIEKRV